MEKNVALPTLEEKNIYLLMDEFKPGSIRPIIEWIMRNNLLPEEGRPDHLTLIINSPGGTLTDCMALCDTMKSSVIPVRTTAIGQIASCGLVTFLCGAKGYRYITKNTSILSHQYSWGSRGKEFELVAIQKEFKLTSERMMNLYTSCTGLSEKKIREILLPPQDIWLSAEEAVKFGIADKIIDTFSI